MRQPAQNSSKAKVDIDPSLKRYVVLLMIGLFGILAADSSYVLADRNLFMESTVSLWFVCATLVFTTLGRSANCIRFVRRVLAFAGPILILSAAFVILNGALDHYPMVRAETRVIRTYLGAGRYGNSHFYVVVSPSWRQGRDQETFEVHGDFYRSLEPGDLIQVEVHRGAFWLTWGPAVTSRAKD